LQNTYVRAAVIGRVAEKGPVSLIVT
jgi:hypothetical protein